MITSNPKHIRKELARVLVPVCKHLKLHGKLPNNLLPLVKRYLPADE